MILPSPQENFNIGSNKTTLPGWSKRFLAIQEPQTCGAGTCDNLLSESPKNSDKKWALMCRIELFCTTWWVGYLR